jgi:hypothetical protein
VFTARYALRPYLKQHTHFVFKGLNLFYISQRISIIFFYAYAQKAFHRMMVDSWVNLEQLKSHKF